MLFLLAGVGGALIFLAGILVSTELSLRKPIDEDNAVEHAFSDRKTDRVPVALHHGGTLKEGRDRRKLFERELNEIRTLLESAKKVGPAAIRKAQTIQSGALERVASEDWEFLKKEFTRGDEPRGYRGLLIVLIGQSGSDQGAAAIAPLYDLHPIKVVEGLKRHGGEAGLSAIQGIYSELESNRPKYGLIKATSGFPGELSRPWLVELMETETEDFILRTVVTQLRQFPSRHSLNALENFARSRHEDPKQRSLVARAFNSMAAIPGGAAHLLSIGIVENEPVSVSDPALRALAFSRDSGAITPALEALIGGRGDAQALEQYLSRNLGPEHAGIVSVFLEMTQDSGLKSRLKALTATD